jgi:hypothetical protein
MTNPIGYFLEDGKRYDVYYESGQIAIINGKNAKLAFDVPFDAFQTPKPKEDLASKILADKTAVK